MGHLLSSLFISISVNLDSFAIGIAYGVKRIRIGILSNLVIATVTTLGTYLSMTVGEVIGRFLPSDAGNIVGATILLLIGIWGIWETLKAEREEKKQQMRNYANDISYTTFIGKPEKADLDDSKFIDVRESIPLAFALTINNLAGGVGAGITGLNVYITTFMTFILAILSIICGYFLGEKFAKKLSAKFAGISSAILIIFVAIYEFFT